MFSKSADIPIAIVYIKNYRLLDSKVICYAG